MDEISLKAIQELFDHIKAHEKDWRKEYQCEFEFPDKDKMTNKVKLITMDGFEKMVDVVGTPKEIVSPLFSEGRSYGERIFKLDKFRDGEYREAPPTSSKKKAELKTYNKIFISLSHDFALQGDDTDITIHVHPKVFNKIHREFSGRDAPENLTFMTINTATCKVNIRFAPEAEKKTLMFAGDLKTLTLRELVDLKLAQEKK